VCPVASRAISRGSMEGWYVICMRYKDVNSWSDIMGVESLLTGAGYQQIRWHAPFRLFNRVTARLRRSVLLW
jgi:hypothetical protein